MNTNYMSKLIAAAMRVVISRGLLRVVSVYDRRWLVQAYQYKEGTRRRWFTLQEADSEQAALVIFRSLLKPEKPKRRRRKNK